MHCCTHRHSDAERESGSRHDGSGTVTGSCNGRAIHDSRVVRRNVNDLRIGRLNNDDLRALLNHLDFFASLEISGCIGFGPHALHSGERGFLLRGGSVSKG